MARPESERSSTFTIKSNSLKPSKFRLTDTSTSSPIPGSPEYRKQAIREFDVETELVAHKQERRTKGGEQNIGELLHNARVLLSNKEYDLARGLLLAVLSQDSNHLKAIVMMGQCEEALGNSEVAERCYIAAVEKEQSVDNLHRLARFTYDYGDDEKARQLFCDVIAASTVDSPELFEAYKNLGNIAVRAGNLELAEENYNLAYTLNPDSDTLLVNFGTLEIQRGHLDVAAERFREAVYINSENDKAWVGLAMIHREYGDHELSWANIEKAMDININNETALQLAVQWSFKDGRTSQVIARLEDYLEQNDQDAAASFLLSKLLYACGRLKHAQIEIERALALSPDIDGGENLVQMIRRDLHAQEERFG